MGPGRQASPLRALAATATTAATLCTGRGPLRVAVAGSSGGNPLAAAAPPSLLPAQSSGRGGKSNCPLAVVGRSSGAARPPAEAAAFRCGCCGMNHGRIRMETLCLGVSIIYGDGGWIVAGREGRARLGGKIRAKARTTNGENGAAGPLGGVVGAKAPTETKSGGKTPARRRVGGQRDLGPGTRPVVGRGGGPGKAEGPATGGGRGCDGPPPARVPEGGGPATREGDPARYFVWTTGRGLPGPGHSLQHSEILSTFFVKSCKELGSSL